MKIEVSDYKGNMVIALSGEIDMHASPALRREIMSLVHRKVTPLVIDLHGVSFIDSSGIATFVEGLKGMKSFGGKLKLVSVPSGVMEIFNFSKLDKVFEIHGTLDDALDS